MAMEKQEISPDSSVDSSSPQSKWLWLSLLIIALDQVTKHIAEANLPLHQAVSLFPFFDWYLTYNTGAAFSFLAGAGGWQRWFFTAVALVVSIIIVLWVRKLPRDETWTAVSLCLILGGAIGNLIDRVYLGHVIDFIQVWLGSYPWPAFNIADASISVGAVLLILTSFIGKNESDV